MNVSLTNKDQDQVVNRLLKHKEQMDSKRKLLEATINWQKEVQALKMKKKVSKSTIFKDKVSSATSRSFYDSQVEYEKNKMQRLFLAAHKNQKDVSELYN
jgi:hypothetical protein